MIDLRNVYRRRARSKQAGLTYLGIGRGAGKNPVLAGANLDTAAE